MPQLAQDFLDKIQNSDALIIAFAGTFVTERIVAPRLGEYKGNGDGDLGGEGIEKLSKIEKKGIKWTLVVMMVITALVLAAIIPENGLLRGSDGSVLNSPLIRGVVAWLLVRDRECLSPFEQRLSTPLIVTRKSNFQALRRVWRNW